MWVLTTRPRVLMSRSIDAEHLKPPKWVRESETCRDDGAPDHQSDSVWETLSNSPALFSVHLYTRLKKVQETRLKIIKILRTKWCDKKGSGWLLIQTSVTREASSCEKSTLIHLQTSSPSLEVWLNKAKPESQRWKFTQPSKTDDDVLNHFSINFERPVAILPELKNIYSVWIYGASLHVTVVLIILILYYISWTFKIEFFSRTCHGLFMLMAMTWKR